MQLIFLNRFNALPDIAPDDLRYPHVRLFRNTWNDYGFETLFNAVIHLSPAEGDQTPLGGIKIGFFGQKATDAPMRAALAGVLPSLPDNHFSLGQDANYYDVLHRLTPDVRRDYAQSLQDIPILRLPIDRLEGEAVFRVSLLRSNRALEALDHATTLHGRQADVIDRFTFRTRITPLGDHITPFNFEPRNGLPHRVNVLVGVNGVGKTQLMAHLAVALSRFEDKETQKAREAAGETFEAIGALVPRPSFYGVVAVSFSAFDDFDIPTSKEGETLAYAYCGIRNQDKALASVDDLAKRIPSAIKRMDTTQKDLFEEILKLVLPQLALDDLPTGPTFYKTLSAGQRIVLNILSDLVLNLRKRSLVLLDEPETHLHPQLITTLMSVLGVLLEQMDAFAIVATHSPIVVQQVMAERVHVVHRIENAPPLVTPPPAETFGENLSEIVRLVFDANESDRDYQEIIQRLFEENGRDVNAVLELLDGRIGFNAQLYLNALARDAV